MRSAGGAHGSSCAARTAGTVAGSRSSVLRPGTSPTTVATRSPLRGRHAPLGRTALDRAQHQQALRRMVQGFPARRLHRHTHRSPPTSRRNHRHRGRKLPTQVGKGTPPPGRRCAPRSAPNQPARKSAGESHFSTSEFRGSSRPATLDRVDRGGIVWRGGTRQHRRCT